MTDIEIIGTWQIIMILIILLLGIIPTIIALVDLLRNKFEDNNKIVWVLVVLFFNLIGAILYFTIGRKQRVKE